MLQTTINIDIDFYDKKYILINAKQLDKQSRFLSITCYNHGEFYHLNEGEHSAYIRYKKADNNSVFNFCEIDRKGNIIVELTEQMLAVDGICVADLVIVNEGGAKVDVKTGEIVGIENTSILSTMPLHIDVIGTAVANSDIESSYEFDGLNDLLERAEAEYTEVILTSKSWAVGNSDIRDGENTDNAKYYAKQSSNSASTAKTSASNASNSATNAKQYMNNALIYSQNSQKYMNSAETYMNEAMKSATDADDCESNARQSAYEARTSEENAADSEDNAKTYMESAMSSRDDAYSSAQNAEMYMDSAKTSETNSLNSSNRAQSYAVGGTGTRSNEDYDNARYYYEKIVGIVNGLETGFIPMGTITFDELATAEKDTGFVYNISTDFTTDASFAEGEGKNYTAGVNVYCRSDGFWDAFGGASSSTATVDEVKNYLGI
jgi:hypothetical protein